jgi:hypothetical protein
MPGRAGVSIVIGSAAVGALATVVTGTGPGVVLGLFVVAGTIAATLAVEAGTVYRIIPVPALSYLVAALLAGLIHDRATGTSSTALAVGATQSIASAFLGMAAATIVAIVVTAVRWPGRSRGPGRPGDRPPGAGADGSRRRQAARNSAAPGRRPAPGSRPAPRGRPAPRSRPQETDDPTLATTWQRRQETRGDLRPQ